jgi:hypothetical protein
MVAVRFRINQEIKFLYRKKHQLNKLLYNLHLECSNYWNGMWQHIQNNIDGQLHITMDTTYQNLNKKLDTLCKHQHHIPTNTTPKYTFHNCLINLTNVQFNTEQICILNLGFHYAIEKHPRSFINTLIVETENAIHHLDIPLQSTYRHLAFKKIKQIMNTNYCNITHKQLQHTLKQIRTILEHNNLSLVKADKGKTIVIIHTDTLQQKVHNFIQHNHMIQLQKDPTDMFHKHILKIIHKCSTVINKTSHKHTTQMKPQAPCLNALIKTHKVDKPIRPVINNIHAPSYKLAKFLNRQLNQMINLPYTYALKNTLEIAQELTEICITNQHKPITFDIKDLYVNLLIDGLLHTTNFWLHKNNNCHTITQQTNDLI